MSRTRPVRGRGAIVGPGDAKETEGAPQAVRSSMRRRRRRGTKKRDPPHVCWNGDAIILCLGFLSLCAPSSRSVVQSSVTQSPSACSLLHVLGALTCSPVSSRTRFQREVVGREGNGGARERERTRERRATRAVSRTVIKLLKNRNHKWF